MSHAESRITLHSFRTFVEQIDSCMDGYLYIQDIEQNLFYLSPKVLERFDLDSNCFVATEDIFRRQVYQGDFDWIMKDLGKLSSGEKDFHDVDYRWMGKDGNPIWIHCSGRSIREESGMIIPLGKWVMNEAMDFCRSMREVYPDFTVNINVSYVQIQKSNFIEEFLSALEIHGLPFSAMTVELTESGAVEGIETEEELQQVHAFGADYMQGYYYSKPCPRAEFTARYH